MPNELSQGQRKLVGVARALAARPKLVCMDEPAAGLDTAESRALGARLRRIIDAGITILLVDHDMGLVLNVCDYIYVIEFGVVIAQGTPAEIRSDATGHRGLPRRSRRTNGRVIADERALLEIEDLSTPATTACRSSGISTSTSTRARSSPCSAPTAPARRRRC